MMAYDGSRTGKAIMQLPTRQEIQQVHASLHGKGVEIQQHLAGTGVCKKNACRLSNTLVMP